MLDSLKQKKNFQRIKMRIKTGDLVKVINGKEKGKTGEVLKIFIKYLKFSKSTLTEVLVRLLQIRKL